MKSCIYIFASIGIVWTLSVVAQVIQTEQAPRLLPLEGTLVADLAPRLDTEQYGTDGMTKTQFLVVCEREIVHYVIDGKFRVFTNMTPTTNFVKRVVPIDDRKTTGVPSIPPIPK